MQVTWPNETWSPGGGLHPKASAALGLEAEGATPKRLGTPVQRTCTHALGTGHTRMSSTCASTGANPPGEMSRSRWRPTALPVQPGAALLESTSQVYRDVSRLPSSCTEPLPVHHSGKVLLWLSTISFSVLVIPRRTSRSSLLLSSAHHDVASPVTVPQS